MLNRAELGLLLLISYIPNKINVMNKIRLASIQFVLNAERQISHVIGIAIKLESELPISFASLENSIILSRTNMLTKAKKAQLFPY